MFTSIISSQLAKEMFRQTLQQWLKTLESPSHFVRAQAISSGPDLKLGRALIMMRLSCDANLHVDARV